MAYECGGLQLDFFPSSDFEPIVRGNDGPLVRNALRLLFMGWQAHWMEVITPHFLNAVLITKNDALIALMKASFREGFAHMLSQLSNRQLTEAEHHQAQLHISNCLCIFPFAEPSPLEVFTIPQKIGDAWIGVDYQVTLIELTQPKKRHHFWRKDHDKVFALGLSPLNNPDALPILVFKGTSYPADDGFYMQILTDLKAFTTPGKSFFKHCFPAVLHWLSKQLLKSQVCGLSLGGALATLFACHLGDKLSYVYALNPPGLHNMLGSKESRAWHQLLEKPEVIVQIEDEDPISKFGCTEPEWILLHVMPAQSIKPPIHLLDHALIYSGHSETQFIEKDVEAHNDERYLRNLIWYSLMRAAFYYSVLIPTTYIFRPTAYFIWEHQLACSAFMFMTGLGLTVLAATLYPSLILLTIGLSLSLIGGLACLLSIRGENDEVMVYGDGYDGSDLSLVG